MFTIKKVVYICKVNTAQNKKTRDMTNLENTTQGQLVKFKSNSDVYRVEEVGYFITLKNMYTEKIMTLRPYTMKGGKMHSRKVEIVRFY